MKQNTKNYENWLNFIETYFEKEIIFLKIYEKIRG